MVSFFLPKTHFLKCLWYEPWNDRPVILSERNRANVWRPWIAHQSSVIHFKVTLLQNNFMVFEYQMVLGILKQFYPLKSTNFGLGLELLAPWTSAETNFRIFYWKLVTENGNFYLSWLVYFQITIKRQLSIARFYVLSKNNWCWDHAEKGHV